jgi:hypothetical protein
MGIEDNLGYSQITFSQFHFYLIRHNPRPPPQIAKWNCLSLDTLSFHFGSVESEQLHKVSKLRSFPVFDKRKI